MPDAPVFVDTGYVIALLTPNDRFHAVAMRHAQKGARSQWHYVTTSCVLIELGDAFYRPRAWQSARKVVEAILCDPNIEVVTPDRMLFDRALTLRNDRADKEWGLTDCISFVVMQDRDMTEALACDQDFIQAGFYALLLQA